MKGRCPFKLLSSEGILIFYGLKLEKALNQLMNMYKVWHSIHCMLSFCAMCWGVNEWTRYRPFLAWANNYHREFKVNSHSIFLFTVQGQFPFNIFICNLEGMLIPFVQSSELGVSLQTLCGRLYFHLIPLRMATIENTNNNKWWKWCGEKKHLYTAGGIMWKLQLGQKKYLFLDSRVKCSWVSKDQLPSSLKH